MKPRPLSVLVVAGTRPEAVKLAPVLRRLRREPNRFRARFLATGQHRELLDAMLGDLGLRPDADLRVMRRGQSPGGVLKRVTAGVERVLARERPDLVLVQGDTTSVLGAALAAFHQKIPVGHVEAGLRSFDLTRPYPEEMNRVIVDRLSALLFAPTAHARRNLRREGFASEMIFTTGNTAVDALLWAARRPGKFREPALRALPQNKFLVTVTLHRRESFGRPLEGVFRGLIRAVQENPDLLLVFPVHPNPAVRSAARRLLRHPRILLVPPLGYLDFVRLMKRSRAILTDSGGIQEEAPSLGKTVLVVREKTERPEVLGAGLGRLVGVGEDKIYRALKALPKAAPRKRRDNPFGDGRAAERIAAAILYWAGRRAARPRTSEPRGRPASSLDRRSSAVGPSRPRGCVRAARAPWDRAAAPPAA